MRSNRNYLQVGLLLLQLYGDGGGCGGESQRVFGKVNTNKDQKQKFKNSESTDERNYFDV